jgi:ATP-dependent Clp protease ATP-binding subunit ClpC
MFERFEEKSIKIIMLAQEETRRLGHNFVGTETILLGLIGEGTAIPAKIFKQLSVNLKDARTETEKIIGRGSGFISVEIPFTPRARRVLELSWEEAKQMGSNSIKPEHILLGVIRESEGVASRVLENLGVDSSKIRSRIIVMLGESGILNKIQQEEIDTRETTKQAINVLARKLERFSGTKKNESLFKILEVLLAQIH